MIKVMQEIPEGSDILFLTNAAYIQNFDKTPTAKSANPDLILQCIEEKKRHNSVGVKIVQYHKSPLLMETHDMATEAMAKQGRSFIMTANEQALLAQMQDLGYSHGLCITALQILSQDKLAVSDMLAFIYDEQPSEEDFIKEMARMCEANSWDTIG